MPVPTRVQAEKNIWIAAGDGDLARVQVRTRGKSIFWYLPPSAAVSPNAPDAFTYTPMHAAASYGQLEVLEYLVSHGGDVNVVDGDGDTPLYTVENIETAQWLVDHGAVVDRRNHENISSSPKPTEHLEEDFPDVAAHLRAIVNPSGATGVASTAQPSQHQQNSASEQLTSSLMQSVQEIMERAESDGHDPDEELRQAVTRTVFQGVQTGFDMSVDANASDDHNGDGDSAAKRPRTDGS
ncbi:hypothetical protein CONPUDRAFT_70869 [Coniophora puteana RWD-64-598 SS2]|uniref:Uncharacterized protein n=1 Tax=Coniophora puteana (strain RWD-64-598) TaxID=741705 RepID=A0A5M3MY74_CONPW|nr:uncharacterized protein CONPUDRAFT_70869 [Coniophora puteana RWD-64-598 SS2]EIW83977.1 hypothetical protein CONPUDRAFT_70869 [Coniophora puteana RWD-64-598 SS2]